MELMPCAKLSADDDDERRMHLPCEDPASARQIHHVKRQTEQNRTEQHSPHNKIKIQRQNFQIPTHSN
jgi:hypothetical protein